MKLISGAAERRQLFPFVLLLAFIVFLSGCVSRPEPYSADYSALLNEEGGMYIQLFPQRDLAVAEKILRAVGLDPGAMDKILDRTDEVHASFRFEGQKLEYRILGIGRYPDTTAALSLRADKSWKRVKRDYSWWEHSSGELQLAFVEHDVVCLSNGAMEEILDGFYNGPVAPLPEDVAVEMNSGLMGIYSLDPRAPSMQVPLFLSIDEFWMKLSRVRVEEKGEETEEEKAAERKTEVYLIDASYECEDENSARSLYLILRLNLLAGMRSNTEGRDFQALMEKDPVTIEKQNVKLNAYPLAIEQLEWFFMQAFPFFTPALKEESYLEKES